MAQEFGEVPKNFGSFWPLQSQQTITNQVAADSSFRDQKGTGAAGNENDRLMGSTRVDQERRKMAARS